MTWPRVSIFVTAAELDAVSATMHEWIEETGRAWIDPYDRHKDCLVIEKADARLVEDMLRSGYEGGDTQRRAAITRVVNKIRCHVPPHPLERLAQA